MTPIKIVWQLLWSLPIGIAFVLLASCVYVGFGKQQLVRFVEGWCDSLAVI